MDNKEAVKKITSVTRQIQKNNSCNCRLFACFYRVKSMRSADQQANHGRWLYWRK